LNPSDWVRVTKSNQGHSPDSSSSEAHMTSLFSFGDFSHSASIISSVSSDSHLRIFDLRTPASAFNHLVAFISISGAAPQLVVRAPTSSPSGALTEDWNRLPNTVVETAGVDSRIRTFDIRNAEAGCLGHFHSPWSRIAVRQLSCSTSHCVSVSQFKSEELVCKQRMTSSYSKLKNTRRQKI